MWLEPEAVKALDADWLMVEGFRTELDLKPSDYAPSSLYGRLLKQAGDALRRLSFPGLLRAGLPSGYSTSVEIQGYHARA
jgi:hypothetical protein